MQKKCYPVLQKYLFNGFKQCNTAKKEKEKEKNIHRRNLASSLRRRRAGRRKKIPGIDQYPISKAKTGVEIVTLNTVLWQESLFHEHQ